MKFPRLFRRSRRAPSGPATDYYARWIACLDNDPDTEVELDEHGRMVFYRFQGSRFDPHVMITITPDALNQYVANIIGSDGTVYGRSPKNEAPESDTHKEALVLFCIHLEEFLFTGEGAAPGPWRLDPIHFIVRA